MIKLYGFGKNLGLYDPSPYVLKVDAYCRMANIDYEFVAGSQNLQKSPTKKLPFIEDGKEIIADSNLIIDYLANKLGHDLDAHLSKEQRNISFFLMKNLDDSLMIYLLYFRWFDVEGWAAVKSAFFGKLPAPIKWIIPIVMKRKLAKKMASLSSENSQNLIEQAEVYFSQLSDLLDDKIFFFGDKPASFDAAIYGLLTQFVNEGIFNKLQKIIKNYPNLIQYCERIEQRYYSS